MTAEIPAPPGKTYLPYQLKGIRYALTGSGTLLADEMGLGKTVQAIGVINATNPARVLIICPKSLVLNWTNELEAWRVGTNTSEVRIITYHEAARKCEACSNAVQDPLGLYFCDEHGTNVPPGQNLRETFLYVDCPYWDLLIVDEAHYIKNPQSQRSNVVKAIAKNAKRVIAITGTPIENRPVELWPLLQIVCPQVWDPPNTGIGFVLTAEHKASHPGEGPNFWRFAKRYCDLRKVTHTWAEGRRSKTSYDFTGASNLDELRTKLRKTCMVRRLKADVLVELPPKRRQLIELDWKSNDYDLIQRFPFNEDDYFDVLKRLTADKVAFADWSKRRHEQALAKVDAVIQHIEEVLDHVDKLVVFAHHTDVILRIVSAVAAVRDYVSVTGSTHVADRGAAVHRFQTDPKCRVFIGSIGAAGVGITLTAASTVIFAELDPVPGKMTQAEDRVHRIGQRNHVLIQHLLLDKTLDARIAKILVKKQAVLTQALDKAGATLVYNEGSSENDTRK